MPSPQSSSDSNIPDLPPKELPTKPLTSTSDQTTALTEIEQFHAFLQLRVSRLASQHSQKQISSHEAQKLGFFTLTQAEIVALIKKHGMPAKRCFTDSPKRTGLRFYEKDNGEGYVFENVERGHVEFRKEAKTNSQALKMLVRELWKINGLV